jgi:hypothetical protein
VHKRRFSALGVPCPPRQNRATLRPLKNAQFCSRSRKARILNTGIPVVFRGLEFESNAEIGQKGAFFKGLTLSLSDIPLLSNPE